MAYPLYLCFEVYTTLGNGIMKKFLLVTFVLLSCMSIASAQVPLSYFSWDIAGSDERIADIGPNAISSGSVAQAQPAGNGSIQGLAPACQFMLFGSCNTRQNPNLVLPNPGNMFDVPEVVYSIDYNKRSRNETQAWFFSRTLNGGRRFNMGLEFGHFKVFFCTDNGFGGTNTHDVNLWNYWGGSTPNDVPNDNVWRTFTFTYTQATGLATFHVDGVLALTFNTGTPGAAMVWPVSNIAIGETADNQGFDETIFDNALVGTPVITPVEYNYLTGEQIGQRNKLSWETANEINADLYRVKRISEAGSEEIGVVKASGFSNGPLQYEFYDPNPQQGVNYYRLEQVDINGGTNLSQIFAINFLESEFGMVACYPNPVRSNESFSVKYHSSGEKSMELSMFDLQGRMVKSETKYLDRELSVFDISTQGISPGLYIVRAVGGGKAWSSKILIQE